MGKRYYGFRRNVLTIEDKMRTRQQIDLHQLAEELDLDIDVEKAVMERKMNITRRWVRKIAQQLGIEAQCDGRGRVIYLETFDDVQRMIQVVSKQVAGRGERLLTLEELRDGMLDRKKKRKQQPDIISGQQLLGDIVGADPEMAALLPSSKLAPVIAMRARDKDQAQETFIQQLVEDWVRTDNWELAVSHFYKKLYGMDVQIPAALFSEGVISPTELHQMWRRLAPALKLLRGKPDLHRIASGGEEERN